MKIAYLGQMADVSHENGIAKKIRAQTQAWSAQGHSVRYFALTPTTAVWPGLAPLETELIARGRAIHRIRRSRALALRIAAWRPDVIYFRYAYHSAGLPALFRAVPTIAEINSDDLTEYPLTLPPAKLLYHRLTRRRVLASVAGFVPVTHELADRFASFSRPAEVIGNGIELGQFPIAPLPPSGPPRLIFVGSAGTPWHGLERVAELARLFPEACFDIVGCTPSDWQRVAAHAGQPPASLEFHGPLPRARYEPLLQRATAAIGTLALFKNRMDEACPLKVREYLACGLPVIAAHRDTDISDDADFFLRLPNNAAPLALQRDRIVPWLDSWTHRRVPRAAIAHLDTAVKEMRRLRFLERLATASKPGHG